SGYDVPLVHERLREILGLTTVWRVGIIGMGRLGQAITDYPAFGEYGFSIAAMFDHDPDVIGQEIAGITATDIRHMPETTASRRRSTGGSGTGGRGRHQGHPELRPGGSPGACRRARRAG